MRKQLQRPGKKASVLQQPSVATRAQAARLQTQRGVTWPGGRDHSVGESGAGEGEHRPARACTPAPRRQPKTSDRADPGPPPKTCDIARQLALGLEWAAPPRCQPRPQRKTASQDHHRPSLSPDGCSLVPWRRQEGRTSWKPAPPGKRASVRVQAELGDAGSLSSDTYTISKREGADGRIIYHHVISSEHFSLGRLKWDEQSC